jgi:uncharacterized alkaline shock family protein YloU
VIRVVDKLLLFLYSLLITVVSIVLVCVGFEWVSESLATDVLKMVYASSAIKLTVIIVAAVVFLISLRFLFISLSRSRQHSHSIDQRTEFGDVRISLETMENLALKSTSKQKSIKDTRVRVNATDVGMDIELRVVVDGEVSIPQLTEEVQKSVKQYIEDITGIPVVNVSVFVANIIQTNTIKSRVE